MRCQTYFWQRLIFINKKNTQGNNLLLIFAKEKSKNIIINPFNNKLMKKLFLITALMLTGFAFYSCDDVVDNPAQDPTQAWNYSVSVKFADFDFTAQPTDPVTGEPNTYVAPKTLYVLNEQNTLMGTITTDVAPAAGDYATYAGKITGSIGNNLIITTKIGNDLGKQDGTLASAIQNGIVQTAEVPIKIYNANSGTLTTASAKLENKTAIANTASGQIKGGDKISVVADDQAFEWTAYEEFDPNISDRLYIALPLSSNQEAEYTISTDSKDGYSRGATFKLADWPALAIGKIEWVGYLPMVETGVDLTKWDAYMRTDPNNAWYMESINNGWIPRFTKFINDDKSFIIKQSGEKLDSLSVYIYGNTDKNVALTIDNIKLGEKSYFEIADGSKFAITLIGENKFETLNLNSPFTKKGDGTWKFNQLNIGGSTAGYDADGKLIVNYAAEYTIDEDINLKYLTLNSGAKLNIADGKKVNVSAADSWVALELRASTLNIGKGASLEVTNSTKDANVIYTQNSKINIGENATVKATGGKNGTAMYLIANNKYNYEFNIGKNATVDLIGGPVGTLGTGIQFECSNSSITDINLAEGAILNVLGIDKVGMICNVYMWEDTGKQTALNFNIAKNAKMSVEVTEGGNAIETYVDYGVINFTGEGTFEAKSEGANAMILRRWNKENYPGAFNFKVSNVVAIGGADKPAIEYNQPFTIDPKITSFKATKGANATLYISKSGEEANLEDLVADKSKFNDATANGTRTITPKSAN